MKNGLYFEKLPNDILVQMIDYLDQPSQLQLCLVSKFMSSICIRILWRMPKCTTPAAFNRLMSVLNSDHQYYPYNAYMIGLNLSFHSTQTLDDSSDIIFSLTSLRMIWIKNVQTMSITLLDKMFATKDLEQLCVFQCLTDVIRDLLVVLKCHGPYEKLERVAIEASHMPDSIVCQMVTLMPALRHFRYCQSGFISDTTIVTLINHCPFLESLILTLPRHIIQANTVTFASLKALSQSKHLKLFVCKGQVRISTAEYKGWLYKYCPCLEYCDLSFDL